MSKSSTLPSPNDPKNNRAGYLSNFKSKIQIGNIKAAASSWVSSPAFKESMNKGTSRYEKSILQNNIVLIFDEKINLFTV